MLRATTSEKGRGFSKLRLETALPRSLRGPVECRLFARLALRLRRAGFSFDQTHGSLSFRWGPTAQARAALALGYGPSERGWEKDCRGRPV